MSKLAQSVARGAWIVDNLPCSRERSRLLSSERVKQRRRYAWILASLALFYANGYIFRYGLVL